VSGHWSTITWQGRQAQAWVPDPIASWADEVEPSTVRRTERAGASVRRADDLLPGTWEPIARILLRTEGVASSDIEGLRAPITDIALAELEGDRSTASWIADNLAVVRTAVASSHTKPLSVAALHRWHRELMRSSPLPSEMIGRFRTAQGWIGGTSPIDAVFVPPPPEEVSGLMRDLVAFANRVDLDPVTQAAMLHGQFETIHPYGDGNGRLGRVLISWLLARRIDVVLPPPVSVLIARDPGGYLSGLYQFRDGSLDAYVRWFADVVARAGEASIALGLRVRELLGIWEERVSDLRADAAARRSIPLLPEHPVIDGKTLSHRLGVSVRSATGALTVLAGRGIVAPIAAPRSGPGRPHSWWMAPELLDLVTAWAG
jgi:Fic family protein